MQDIIFSNIMCSQGSAKIFFFWQWNFTRMKNKSEFCIWKRMKYEKVVAKWHSKATGVSFLSSTPERFYHRIRHTLAASVIFHLRRDIGQNAYHSNAINRFRSEFELLLNRMIVFVEWFVFFLFWFFIFYLLTNLRVL